MNQYFKPLPPEARIYVAGHAGLVGSAVVRCLNPKGFKNIIARDRRELDLCDQKAVRDFFSEARPEYAVMAAAKVGGIHANNIYRAEFIYDNLAVELNIIDSAYRAGVKRLIFLGSSCIYPQLCPQPMKEEYLLTGPLEPTNEPYAVAKIAGIKLCEAYNSQYGTDFTAIMPTNLYGPNDNFNLDDSHVLPAFIRKIHEAMIGGDKTVEIWGTGNARREFMHVDDLAQAVSLILQMPGHREMLNVGTGSDVTIKELAGIICDTAGYKGELRFDSSKPDGHPQKLLDVSKINKLGWHAGISLKEGIKSAYSWYVENKDKARK